MQGRILSEKGIETFRNNPDRDWRGRVKQKQTLTLEEYKSLMKTVSKVKDGDKRERQLDEKEKNIDYKAIRVKEREQDLTRRENNLEEKREKVERGLYDNTNKKLKTVERNLEDLKEFCGNIKYKDGSTVLEKYHIEKQLELEKQEKEKYYGHGGYSR